MTRGIRHNPTLPAPGSSSAFMNGPASQTADWLSRQPRGPISSGGRLVSAWGLRSYAAVNGGEPLPQGGEEGEGVLYVYLFLNSLHCSGMWDNYVRSESWLQLPTIALGLPVASRTGIEDLVSGKMLVGWNCISLPVFQTGSRSPGQHQDLLQAMLQDPRQCLRDDGFALAEGRGSCSSLCDRHCTGVWSHCLVTPPVSHGS